MRSQRITICIVLVVLVVTGSTKAYFELHDNEQLPALGGSCLPGAGFFIQG